MMKLERLRIDKFRNVKPGSEIRFADGFNIVLGRNGTGKTTLLDLISRIVRWDFKDLEEEEFAIAYELSEPGVHFSVELANEKVLSGTMAVMPGAQLKFRASARATMSKNGKLVNAEVVHGHLRVNDEPRELELQNAELDWAISLMLLVPEFDWPTDRYCLSSHGSVRFDESLDQFRKTWESKDYPGDMTFFSWRVHHAPMPNELAAQLQAQWRIASAFRSFTTAQATLPFLDKAVQAMGFVSAELRVDVLDRDDKEDYGSIKLGNMIARFFFGDGRFITQDRLSYGQKRLLMFYYYVASNPDIVIADELVNGLHHQWINACIEEIGERQAFLTSQNPVLLDYLPFFSADEVHKSFVLCTSDLDDNQKRIWSWSNMSEEAAKEFYSAYEVGIEHVSEILQSQGLF